MKGEVNQILNPSPNVPNIKNLGNDTKKPRQSTSALRSYSGPASSTCFDPLGEEKEKDPKGK